MVLRAFEVWQVAAKDSGGRLNRTCCIISVGRSLKSILGIYKDAEGGVDHGGVVTVPTNKVVEWCKVSGELALDCS